MAADKKDSEEKEEKKPKRKKTLLIVIVLVVFLVVVIGGGYLALQIGLLGGLIDSILGVGETRQEQEAEEVYTPPDYTFELPEVLVNMPGERRQFLSVKFYVGYHDEDLTEELERRKPEIKDAALGILWGKTKDDIETKEDKEQLRQELYEEINAMLTQGEIQGVYFWHIMVQ